MGLKGLLFLGILIATFLLISSKVAARELTETSVTKDSGQIAPHCSMPCCRRGGRGGFYGGAYYGGVYYGPYYGGPYYGSPYYGNPYYGGPNYGSPYYGGPYCCCSQNYAGQEGRHAKP